VQERGHALVVALQIFEILLRHIRRHDAFQQFLDTHGHMTGVFKVVERVVPEDKKTVGK
jgi:hypothetical protein